MTARPVDPESRRRPVFAAVALVLVMVAVLLAAGCVSHVFDNKSHTSQEEKFVILNHNTDNKIVPKSGLCFHHGMLSNYVVHFDEKSGMLTIRSPPLNKGQINESLILFYFYSGKRIYDNEDDSTGDRGYDGDGWGVYSLPSKLSENVILESVTKDGTVALRYSDDPIILKPNERWENITRRIDICECTYIVGKPDPVTSGCSEEIITTERIYNAGVFDKKGIVVDER